MADNSRLVRQWLSEFGMTPATVASLDAPPLLDQPNSLEELLQGR